MEPRLLFSATGVLETPDPPHVHTLGAIGVPAVTSDELVEVYTRADHAAEPGSIPDAGGSVALFTLTGWQWPASRIPINYYVNTANIPTGIAVAEFVSAIDNAFQIWADVETDLPLQFTKVGEGTAFAPGTGDGMTTLGFGTAVPGALAQATTWVDGDGVT